MNHAYNLTVEQQLTDKHAFSVAYVGTAGRDLVNWRDLNACPISTRDACEPLGSLRRPIPAIQPYPPTEQRRLIPTTTVCSLLSKCERLHGFTGQINSPGQSLRHWFRQSRRRLLRITRIPTTRKGTMRLQISIRRGTSISPWFRRAENPAATETDRRRLVDQLAVPGSGRTPVLRVYPRRSLQQGLKRTTRTMTAAR